MDPSTPAHQRPLRRSPASPTVLCPQLHPYASPTPLPKHPTTVFPDLFARVSCRTLSAADSLLHLASSPTGSPYRFLTDSPYRPLALYPSASTGSSRSHDLDHSQSTFPPTPPPTTPSRSILSAELLHNARVDVLDLESHLFSSPAPIFVSPNRCELEYPCSTGISPVLHENEKGLELAYPDDDCLPVLPSVAEDPCVSPCSSRSADGRISAFLLILVAHSWISQMRAVAR